MRVFLTGLLCAAWPSAAQALNPLTGDLNAHDPVIIKAGGAYYVFHTGNGVAMKTSADRKAWKNAGRVFETAPAWHKEMVPLSGTSLWAPDISYRDGKFWLYYSVSSFGSQVSAIGLATADTLLPGSGATRWVDQGMVVRTTDTSNHNAIDPNVYTDSDGSLWLTWGSFWSGIQLIRLNPATGKPAAGAGLTNIASRSAGIEAPFLFRRGGFHWLFVSFDKCCNGATSTYNIRVGRSATVAGPYQDSAGVPMKNGGGTLIDAGDARWKGPGHNAIFADNDSVFLVNHAYDAQNNGTAKLWIRPLYWGPDGWPTLDAKGGTAIVARRFRGAGKSGRARRQDVLGRLAPFFQPATR